MKRNKKVMIKESVALTGADVAKMIGGSALEVYQQAKAKEVELDERIEEEKKRVNEMFRRLDSVIL